MLPMVLDARPSSVMAVLVGRCHGIVMLSFDFMLMRDASTRHRKVSLRRRRKKKEGRTLAKPWGPHSLYLLLLSGTE